MSTALNTTAARTSIDAPGELVRVGAEMRDLPASIRAGQVLIEVGVRLSANIEADEVFVHGELTGRVDARQMTVGTPGVVIGECHVDRLNMAGRFNGLARARVVVARDGSKLEGELVANKLSRQDNAALLARVAVAPGYFGNDELVAQARRRLTNRSVRLVEDLRRPPMPERLVALEPIADRPPYQMPVADSDAAIPFLVR